MTQTADSDICQQYLINYIEDLKNQIDQYQMELGNQSALCPITSLSLDHMDHCLKEFVNGQRNYLSRRNNDQLVKFKDHIEENELFEIITTYYPTVDQVSIISQRYI
jgi:hypothetical protein